MKGKNFNTIVHESRTSGRGIRVGLSICVLALLLDFSVTGAIAQPKPLPVKKVYAVATFTAPDSPTNAGNQATLHMQDWVSRGWTPLGVAAQYSMQEAEGTTVKASPLWAVHVLMECTAGPGSRCQAPAGPQPHP